MKRNLFVWLILSIVYVTFASLHGIYHYVKNEEYQNLQLLRLSKLEKFTISSRVDYLLIRFSDQLYSTKQIHTSSSDVIIKLENISFDLDNLEAITLEFSIPHHSTAAKLKITWSSNIRVLNYRKTIGREFCGTDNIFRGSWVTSTSRTLVFSEERKNTCPNAVNSQLEYMPKQPFNISEFVPEDSCEVFSLRESLELFEKKFGRKIPNIKFIGDSLVRQMANAANCDFQYLGIQNFTANHFFDPYLRKDYPCYGKCATDPRLITLGEMPKFTVKAACTEIGFYLIIGQKIVRFSIGC